MNTDLHRHEISGVATFTEGPGGLTVLDIATPSSEARIFLHGAQLTHWRPAGHESVIFMSSESLFHPGKAIRGGVPVCFPWFGPGAQPSLPAHGFVRNREWEVESVTTVDEGVIQVVLKTTSDEKTRALWPHDYVARLIYTVGPKLTMELAVENTSSGPFTFSEALHTYLLVGDARSAVVTGLENTDYRDFPDRSKLLHQTGPIRFTAETDRVYVNTKATCLLDDPVMGRRITVSKRGSDATTVWNPWIAKAAALADFGDDEWLRMVCIETVNAAENSVTVPAGESHRMTAEVSVETLMV
jgi:glucose-6-phosphate 1-epimerase